MHARLLGCGPRAQAPRSGPSRRQMSMREEAPPYQPPNMLCFAEAVQAKANHSTSLLLVLSVTRHHPDAAATPHRTGPPVPLRHAGQQWDARARPRVLYGLQLVPLAAASHHLFPARRPARPLARSPTMGHGASRDPSRGVLTAARLAGRGVLTASPRSPRQTCRSSCGASRTSGSKSRSAPR